VNPYLETLFDRRVAACQTRWNRFPAPGKEKTVRTSSHHFADDGDIPNNRLPLIAYMGAIDGSASDPARAFESLFAENGWGGMWRNGIFPFHHYHSTAHEVLGIAKGEAEVRFGGEAGETLTLKAGDAVLIPAGVGHKRLSSTPDLLVIGAYPAGQRADLMREGAEDKAGIRQRIDRVALPATDPVAGPEGPLHEIWKE
jgi:uncharacterized protein YjlB